MGNNCFKLPLQATRTAQQGCHMEDYCQTFVHRDHLVHSFLLEIHCTTSSFQERVILIQKINWPRLFVRQGLLFSLSRECFLKSSSAWHFVLLCATVNLAAHNFSVRLKEMFICPDRFLISLLSCTLKQIHTVHERKRD